MKAFVTSVGEPTTELSIWALKRHGFDVELVEGTESLGEKLKYIYETAPTSFIRVDADVVVNSNIKMIEDGRNVCWWEQFKVWDMYKQELGTGGVQYITKNVLKPLREHIDEFKHDDRPETRMWRLPVFDDKRYLFQSRDEILGIHGFGQKDLDRVKGVKDNRKGLGYDWELAERLQEFYK